MFDISDNKMFMDAIHGYISIPKVFVENIIDTEYFQRLHNINQTGMSILYPNGKHDRYSHSLGVYFLGLRSVDALLNNFHKNMYWNIRSDNTCDVFWAKNKVLFLIACLLHDIGHAPFSHSLEDTVLKNSTKLNTRLAKNISRIEVDEPLKEMDIKASQHEIIGSLLIFDKLKPLIKNVLDSLKTMKYPNTRQNYLSEYAKEPPVINSNDIDEDICFIVRMILGLKYKSYKPEKQIQNCFIELLNGKNFDVDKLDYIIRDTKMSGISNINIDVDRLLNALTLVTLTEYDSHIFKNYEIWDKFIKKFVFDVNNSCEMNGYFDGVIELDPDTKVTIGHGSENITLEPCLHQPHQLQTEAKISVSEYADLKKANEVRFGEKEIPYNEHRKVYPIQKGEETHVLIRDATVSSDTNFVFMVVQNKYELKLKGNCVVKIQGSANIEFAKFRGTLNGKCKKLSIIGDVLSEHMHIPNESAYNSFSVGFKKQAINLLSNVLEARDYLYLWIYAHHKVIYYANFLIPYLAELFVKYTSKDEYPKWTLDYDNITLIDDSYFVTTLKYLYKEKANSLNKEELDLLQEFFSRKYKKSLYKSLAEYDLFFDDFNVDEKNNIKGYFDKICSESTREQRDNLSYGIVPNRIINEINSYGDEVVLNNLIWVSASYSHKILNKLETYCVFPDKTVTMEYLSLFKSQEHFSTTNTNQYFYLYYDAQKGSEEQVKNVLLEHMKKIKETNFE